MRGGVTDAGRTNNEQTVKIELLSQWKLEAEFRNMTFASVTFVTISVIMISNSVIGVSLAQESDDPLEALR